MWYLAAFVATYPIYGLVEGDWRPTLLLIPFLLVFLWAKHRWSEPVFAWWVRTQVQAMINANEGKSPLAEYMRR